MDLIRISYEWIDDIDKWKIWKIYGKYMENGYRYINKLNGYKHPDAMENDG